MATFQAGRRYLFRYQTMPKKLFDQVAPENRAEVDALCVYTLFERARLAALFAPLGTLFIFWIGLDQVGLPLAAGWVLVTTVPDAVTFALTTRLLKHDPPSVGIASGLSMQVALRILQGLCWGAAAVLFHTSGTAVTVLDMIILCVLVAISATSVVNMAPSFRTLSAFCVSLLSVPILYSLWLGDQTHVQIAVGLGILLLVEIQFGWNAYRQFEEGMNQLVLNRRAQRELKQRNRELDEANRLLREIAIRDQLTRLYNRHYMVEQLERQREQLSRHGHPCSIVLFDVDHFKQINDRYGHGVGDAVLVAFSRRVEGLLRQGDTLGRYGGEEFMLILPMCDSHAALQMAERVRAALASSPVVMEPEAITATASFGVAQLQPGEDADAWLLRADEALYRAKEQGRNCVMA